MVGCNLINKTQNKKFDPDLQKRKITQLFIFQRRTYPCWEIQMEMTECRKWNLRVLYRENTYGKIASFLPVFLCSAFLEIILGGIFFFCFFFVSSDAASVGIVLADVKAALDFVEFLQSFFVFTTFSLHPWREAFITHSKWGKNLLLLPWVMAACHGWTWFTLWVIQHTVRAIKFLPWLTIFQFGQPPPLTCRLYYLIRPLFHRSGVWSHPRSTHLVEN